MNMMISEDRYWANKAEDYYGNEEHYVCSHCGKVIANGAEYFDIDGDIYCMGCEDTVRDVIFDKYKEVHLWINE